MPTSDSEDFESADEGNVDIDNKKGRKQRLSSSNYRNDTFELDKEPSLLPQEPTLKTQGAVDGWDDFDIEDNVPRDNQDLDSNSKSHETSKALSIESSKKNEKASKDDDGWDTFDDWGDDNVIQNQKETQSKSDTGDQDLRQVTEKLASANMKNTGWGWGWGVDSLLSTATAGISNITSQVSQGITTVLETGIGAPDPEELARKVNEDKSKQDDEKIPTADNSKVPEELSSGDVFPFGNLISGVTKFVETTGTRAIAGGLDTLETIGKKTMEVLQHGDPGLAKKRAMLGLDTGDKPVLSQVLREAKARSDEEDRIREEKREAKEVHYENLFDDFEGLVHLEALEMLSKQVSMRIDERIRNSAPEKRQEIKETLQQVAELCEMPEDEDDDQVDESLSKPDALHDRLQTATQDLGLKLQFQPIVKQYTEILEWLETPETSEKAVYKRAVGGLAHATASSVEIYHKAAEMLLVKTRRSTADESDALTQMTAVLTKHISELATLFTEKLNSLPSESKQQANMYITNIFLEAGNSSTYIQNAFQLALPILQIGAV